MDETGLQRLAKHITRGSNDQFIPSDLIDDRSGSNQIGMDDYLSEIMRKGIDFSLTIPFELSVTRRTMAEMERL